MKGKKHRTAASNSLQSRHLATLQPVAHPEVTAALTVNALLRGVAGFFVFLIAFGLRRIHAPLFWYGLVLGMSGLGAMVGLVVMARIRRHFSEQTILVIAAVLVCLAGVLAAWVDAVWIQIVLALLIGIGGSLGQPSFDAMAQRYVPVEVQGRAFARFATRQQLVWVIGALLAVIIPLTLKEGDITVAAVAGASVIGYGISRFMMRNKALPRAVQHHERD
jgi:MFS family permease